MRQLHGRGGQSRCFFSRRSWFEPKTRPFFNVRLLSRVLVFLSVENIGLSTRIVGIKKERAEIRYQIYQQILSNLVKIRQQSVKFIEKSQNLLHLVNLKEIPLKFEGATILGKRNLLECYSNDRAELDKCLKT